MSRSFRTMFQAQVFAMKCWFHGLRVDFEHYRDSKGRHWIECTPREPDGTFFGIVGRRK